MAAPGFGFSFGDFVSALGLIKKVSKALKNIGGASSEYQHVVIELNALQNVLRHLETLQPTEHNINHVNAIRGMALACQMPLRDFLVKLEKYEASMSLFVRRGTFAGTKDKTKWALLITEDVDKLRALVAAKVMSINLLLVANSAGTLDRIEVENSTRHVELLTKTVEHRNEIMRAVKKEGSDVRIAISQTREVVRNSAIRYDKASTNLQSDLDSVAKRAALNTAQLDSISSTNNAIQTSVASLHSIGKQVLHFISSFPVELRQLLQSIMQSNLQTYQLLLLTHNNIAATPNLSLQSNIRFEDALGRAQSLPYQWFKHWDTFESMLKVEFKDMPGEDMVLNSHYHILDTARNGRLISKENWSSLVFPGSSISMSMIISFLRRQAGRCPRPSCMGKQPRENSSPEVTCSECGIIYFPIWASIDDTLEQVVLLDEEGEVARRQEKEDLELFGARARPWDIDNLSLPLSRPTNLRRSFDDRSIPASPGPHPDGTESRRLRSSSTNHLDTQLPEYTRWECATCSKEILSDSSPMDNFDYCNCSCTAAPVKSGDLDSDINTHKVMGQITSAVRFEAKTEESNGVRATNQPENNEDGCAGDNIPMFVTGIDWNSGLSPIDAWLNQSAVPTVLIATNIVEPIQSTQEGIRKREVEGIEVFRKIHISVGDLGSARVPEEVHLEIEHLELMAQIYYRNIRDQYPSLPMYLAVRLAVANLHRSERLKEFAHRISASALVEGRSLARTRSLAAPEGFGEIPVTYADGNENDQILPTNIAPKALSEIEQLETNLSVPGKRAPKFPAIFQCELCPKRFTRAYNLRTHLRTHTERSFVCITCGKAFARQDRRNRHERIHSGESTVASEIRMSPKELSPSELSSGSFWTNREGSTGSRSIRSRSSSMNDSLHGYEVFGVPEENPIFESRDQGESDALSFISWLPPPPSRSSTIESVYSESEPADETRYEDGAVRFRQQRKEEGEITTDIGKMEAIDRAPEENGQFLSEQKDIPKEGREYNQTEEMTGKGSPTTRMTEIECDICGERIMGTRGRDWQRHVLRDILPYICTVEGCSNEHVQYPTRKAMTLHIQKHMRQIHSPIYDEAREKDDIPQTTSGVQAFSDAFTSFPHPNVEDFFSGTQAAQCMFCKKIIPAGRSNYGRHVGEHMEQISFAVLSRPYEEWEFYEDSSYEGGG